MTTTSLRNVVAASFKANLKAAIVMNACVAALLALYFSIYSVEAAFSSLGEYKATNGYLFSFISTGIFGGLLPLAIEIKQKRPIGGFDYEKCSQTHLVIHAIWFFLFWGLVGVIIDAMYRGQALLFGDNNEPATIIKKVLVDQFLYNPLFANPFIAIAYAWEKQNFKKEETIAAIRDRELWSVTYPSMLISVWMIWIPAVTGVYMLPSDVQIPIFNVVLVFNCCVLNAITKRAEKNHDDVQVDDDDDDNDTTL